MSDGDSDEFELDEPAAKSHTPPGWPVQTIEFSPGGKAPKKYGPTTYRFSAALTLSVILPRRGWTVVKKAKNYVYLIPPPEQTAPPFRISIAVPHAIGGSGDRTPKLCERPIMDGAIRRMACLVSS